MSGSETEKGSWPSDTLPFTWEWIPFKQAYDNVTSSNRKLKQKQYLEKGSIPVVDQGKELIGGYTENKDILHESELPCIVFGDHTRCVKFIDFNFVQGADGVKVLKPTELYTPEFSYRVLQAVCLPDKGYSRHFKFLKATSFPLPPSNEQKRIAAKIATLEAKSKKVKQALDAAKPLLDKLRQSILASAFRGDLTAEWRKKNSTIEPANHLLGKIQDERNDVKERANTRYSFKITSEIDERFINIAIPSTWIKTNIDSVSIYIVDCAHSTPKWTTSGKMCLRTTNFSPFKLKLDEVKYVSEKTYQNRIERLKPEVGDILYSREGGILGIACILDLEADVCLGQRMMLFRPSHSVSSKFFSYYLNSPILMRHVSNLIGGSASPHINIRDIKKYPFPLPPIEEQQEISSRIDNFFKFVDDIERNHFNATVKLNKLSQSILSIAFKGKLVPQNPSDESAAHLLEKIRSATK